MANRLRFQRSASLLGAVLLAGAGLASGSGVAHSAGSARAAEAREPAYEARTVCSGWVERYGASGYTYSKMRLCINVVKNSIMGQLYADNNEVQYWWSGGWWNPSNKWPAKVTITGTLTKSDGRSKGFEGEAGQGTPDKKIDLTPMNWRCGTYKIDYVFKQVGPYWDTNPIHRKAVANIMVPCGPGWG
ncbi:hypothetical protein ACFVXC_23015 [Streptomyces sp. NPDC058257]|uniref:hypothetical protein n=1 Tax=Streptomyces sp. NPDC058257 TaxID=3346409 RepID=UPI0036E957B2